jgi:iron only hydrogenase large subunit-like protein
MAVQRLQKELKNLNKEPLPGLRAKPHPNNILEWHYCLEGKERERGVVHLTQKTKHMAPTTTIQNKIVLVCC